LPNQNQEYAEIQVFEGFAERTGVTVDSGTVRRSPALCRSLSELTRKARSKGDGYFYLPVSLWPENTKKLQIRETWVSVQ
jgi:hypothetical protein